MKMIIYNLHHNFYIWTLLFLELRFSGVPPCVYLGTGLSAAFPAIPYSIKILKRSSFRKKIKELLLNFLRSEDDYVEVSRLIKLFNTLG